MAGSLISRALGGGVDPRHLVVPLPRLNVAIGAFLCGLPALLFVYMPRPPVPGSHFLIYPAMAGVLAIVAAHLFRERPVASRAIVGWLLLLLSQSVVTGISLLVNASELRASAPAELFKPLVYAVFLVYGYAVGRRFGPETLVKGLIAAALLILVGQTVLGATQAVGLPVFSVIYQSDKSFPFGRLLRITGSLSNPNTFAWMVAQSAVIVSLMHRSKLRGLWISLATLLVLISGSRTLLLLFPLMVATAQVLRDPTNLRTYARYFLFAIGLLALFVGIIAFLGNYFPYLAQLKTIVASGSLLSVRSFSARLEMWARAREVFATGGISAWLIGLGARDSIAIMDNDFLYVFFRLGTVGFVVHFTIIVAALVIFLRARNTPIGVFGAEYVIFALVFGLVSESTASWYLPLVMFATLGLVLGNKDCAAMKERVLGPGALRAPGIRSVRLRWS